MSDRQIQAEIGEILARHPDPCDKHPDDDPIACGWKRLVMDLRAAWHRVETAEAERGGDCEAALRELLRGGKAVSLGDGARYFREADLRAVLARGRTHER